MTDVILGMGEVGCTMFDLLTERGIDCVGIDVEQPRCRNYAGGAVDGPEYLHVCVPGEMEGFEGTVLEWIGRLDGVRAAVVHSTIRPGTTTRIQEKATVSVLFSPVRGVHRRFLEDMRRYTKVIASDREVDPTVRADLERRFVKTAWMSTSKTAELAKILVDTSYYGWLINYAQITKMICDREEVDFDEMWGFADEIQEFVGNRPKMYPGVIGGHCVIPNLGLVEYEDLDAIRRINEEYEKAGGPSRG